MTIKTAPKKYEYAVRDRLEGYFAKIGAWNTNMWKKRMETSGHIDAFEQVSEYKNERQSQMQVCNIGQCESKNVKKDYFL
jgi:hypothetical protein